MGELTSLFAASTSGMSAQATRLRLISENIANADTPGYRRKLVSFEAAPVTGDDLGTVRLSRLRLDRSGLERMFDPSHPLAGTDGYYESSNVDLLIEIADAREANRSYEANLKMLDQAKQMITSTIETLLR